MGLADFLYRCPECGADPISATRQGARCVACGSSFVPAPEGEGIRVRTPSGVRRTALAELGRALERHGGPLPRAKDPNGNLAYEAPAVLRVARSEEPVYHEGQLLGFTEQFGPPVAGVLGIVPRELRFREAGGAPSHRWELCNVRALQASSSAVQLSLPDSGVVLFRFPEDSPRRWEALLAHALREVWRELGRGEIVEFQPRIRVQ